MSECNLRLNAKPFEDWLEKTEAAIAGRPKEILEQLLTLLSSGDPGLLVITPGISSRCVELAPGPRLDRFLETLTNPETYSLELAQQVLMIYLENGSRGVKPEQWRALGLDDFKKAGACTEENLRRRLAEILGGRVSA